MKLLSRNEEILLLAIWRLQDDAYGLKIRDVVSSQTGYEWAIGAIYGPLRKLEAKHLVQSKEGEPIPERRGRGRVFYTVTHDGQKALADIARVHNEIWDELPAFSMSAKGAK